MLPSPNVLIVDDLEDNLLALEAVLRPCDANLFKARSGREALEVLLSDEIALAIIDVQMPEMDGFELAELMRGTERTRQVPIMFVTAGLHDQSRVFRGYDAGAVDFLYKPLDPQVLRSKVEVFLQLNRQKRELAQQLAALQRAQEELREANQRKDEFLGLLSHELRNPLTPIRTSLYLLRRAEAGSEQASRARDVIERQIAHMARLVDDLLDVTRITRGKVQLRRERMNVVETVRRTAEDHRAAFAAGGLAFVVSLPAEPLVVDADATRIAQAVGNLLGNALKFTPPGGKVELSLAPVDGHAVIRVRDNGVGIGREMLARIFQPFAQADRTLARSVGGLGLGLALAKGMIELHGGSVEAHSDGPGTGASFALRIPVETAAAPMQAPAPDATEPGARSVRVLVVEDNRDAAESLREAFELMGHDVVVGRDGPEGIALAQQHRPEVVLCDIGLPGKNGYEVARELKALVPEALLVAVSGYAGPDDVRKAEEAGFQRHLSKPPEMEALERLLASAGHKDKARA